MNDIVKPFTVIAVSCFLAFIGKAQTVPVYQDMSAPVEDRVEDALSRMTLEEKVALLHADRSYGAAGVPRLGIPENDLTDGPSGMRPEMVWQTWAHAGMSSDSCTAYPALVCLAATWNPDLGYLFGRSYGREAVYRSKNMILGPGVNIFRTPMNGRNFEYMGEDPYLTSEMAVSYIKGVQSDHVAACVKHFAVNNQETGRTTINTVVDERTLHEIYFPAFKAAVQEGGVWAIMGAYNKFDGQHCCHNRYLLKDVLKGQWGFDGVVVSDFGGTHDTKEAVENGLDLEMGTDLGSVEAFRRYKLADPYLEMLRSGEASMEELDDKVRRVLRMLFRTKMSGRQPWGLLASETNMAESRRIAEEGIVLLKNDADVLPLNLSDMSRILVVGENACRIMSRSGGSSEVKSKYEIVPLEGIRTRVKDSVDVIWQPGYMSDATPEKVDSLRKEAIMAAHDADVVIYVGGLNKEPGQDCEGVDRQSFNLPYMQDELISGLAATGKELVLVMISGNSYVMPWIDDVHALVQAWYGGSEAGSAIAAVLFGDVNPSGKLPFSFHKSIGDCGANALGAYPGDGKKVEYSEGIFVGYRWLEKKGIEPRFAFGHGLSYTDFKYGKVRIDHKRISADDSLTVSVSVTNSGNLPGAEVVQLYIGDKVSSLPRPVKELKGFRKVFLAPGQTAEVSFVLHKDAFSFYDPGVHRWVAEPGGFSVMIGSSSSDIRGRADFVLE